MNVKGILARPLYYPASESGLRFGLARLTASAAQEDINHIEYAPERYGYKAGQHGALKVEESTIAAMLNGLVPTAISSRWNNFMCKLGQ